MKVLVLNFMARAIRCQCFASHKLHGRGGARKRRKSKHADRLEQENAEVCLRLVNECHMNKRSPVAEFRANKINVGNNVGVGVTHHHGSGRHANCNPGPQYHSASHHGNLSEYMTTSLIDANTTSTSNADVRRLTVMEEILKYLKIMVAKRDEDDQENEIINEWQQVAMVMDRFLFWTFLMCTVVATLIMMVIIPVVRSYTAMEQGPGI